MRILRQAWGIRPGLPAAGWMLSIGAFFLRTETELLLKSRCVIPGRLLDAGFQFLLPDWNAAAHDLVTQFRALCLRKGATHPRRIISNS
jgi:NAD dependent epimerase/dehydratase family enzyme